MEISLKVVEYLAETAYEESTVPSWEPLSTERKYKVPPSKKLEAIMEIKNHPTNIAWL